MTSCLPRSPPLPLPEAGRAVPGSLDVALATLRDRSANLVHNAKELVDDIVVRETHYHDPRAHEAVVSASVVCLALDVARAVDLDHKVALVRVEVRDVSEKRALAAERRAGLMIRSSRQTTCSSFVIRRRRARA